MHVRQVTTTNNYCCCDVTVRYVTMRDAFKNCCCRDDSAADAQLGYLSPAVSDRRNISTIRWRLPRAAAVVARRQASQQACSRPTHTYTIAAAALQSQPLVGGVCYSGSSTEQRADNQSGKIANTPVTRRRLTARHKLTATTSIHTNTNTNTNTNNTHCILAAATAAAAAATRLSSRYEGDLRKTPHELSTAQTRRAPIAGTFAIQTATTRQANRHHRVTDGATISNRPCKNQSRHIVYTVNCFISNGSRLSTSLCQTIYSAITAHMYTTQ